MNILAERLAHRYAQAFINSFSEQFSLDDARKLHGVFVTLEQEAQLPFFLEIPTISNDTKIKLITQLFEGSSLYEPIKRLISLLVTHKRGTIFLLCLKYIWWLFQEQKDIVYFNMISSHKLSKNAQKTVKNFLERLSGKKVIYDTFEDKTLIAGMRLQSDQLLWEYSIRKQLLSVTQVMNNSSGCVSLQDKTNAGEPLEYGG